jgi:hypothetical protein
MADEPRESSQPPAVEVPHVRAFVIHGHRSAAVDLWGEAGLEEIARQLPASTRARTVDELLLATAWTPVADVIDWYIAVWEGPAGRSEPLFSRFLARSVDFGFARVRRDLLKLGNFEQLPARMPSLWRRQHTHGELSGQMVTNAQGVAIGVVIRLRDHPLVETPLARLGIAETWRKILSVARGRPVKQTHTMDGETLVATLTWGG